MSKQATIYMKTCAPTSSMLQDERRWEITQLPFEHRELSVMAPTEKLSLLRPAVSHHLRLLSDAELVTVRRKGKEWYYQINLKPALTHLKNLTDSIENDIRRMES